jgi:hypothetical protein
MVTIKILVSFALGFVMGGMGAFIYNAVTKPKVK